MHVVKMLTLLFVVFNFTGTYASDFKQYDADDLYSLNIPSING